MSGSAVTCAGLPARPSYRATALFPLLAQALLARGFSPEDAGKILGGNYARVFAITVG
jgi:membrane dipeptidase